MNVIFVITQTGQQVHQMVVNDIAGMLAAVQGEAVTFPFGNYSYDCHTLDFYENEGTFVHELVIYLK